MRLYLSFSTIGITIVPLISDSVHVVFFKFARAVCGDADSHEVAGARFETLPTSRRCTIHINGTEASTSVRCVSRYSLIPIAMRCKCNKRRKCRHKQRVSIVLYYTNVYEHARLIAAFDVALLARLFFSVEFSSRVIYGL